MPLLHPFVLRQPTRRLTDFVMVVLSLIPLMVLTDTIEAKPL